MLTWKHVPIQIANGDDGALSPSLLYQRAPLFEDESRKEQSRVEQEREVHGASSLPSLIDDVLWMGLLRARSIVL